MKHLTALFLVIFLTSTAFAAISTKAGLAGGAFRVAAILDRPLNDKMTIAGEAGYALGSNYNIINAGALGKYLIRDGLNAGINLGYSSYSTGVQNIVGVGNLSSGGGIGAGIFAELKIREGLFGQLGYDSRLGLLAEVSYLLRQ